MNDDNICIKIKPSDFFSGNYSWNYYMFLWSTTTLSLWTNKKNRYNQIFFLFFISFKNLHQVFSSFQYSKYKISFIYNQMVNFFSLFSYSDLFSPDNVHFFCLSRIFISFSDKRKFVMANMCAYYMLNFVTTTTIWNQCEKKTERGRDLSNPFYYIFVVVVGKKFNCMMMTSLSSLMMLDVDDNDDQFSWIVHHCWRETIQVLYS